MVRDCRPNRPSLQRFQAQVHQSKSLQEAALRSHRVHCCPDGAKQEAQRHIDHWDDERAEHQRRTLDTNPINATRNHWKSKLSPNDLRLCRHKEDLLILQVYDGNKQSQLQSVYTGYWTCWQIDWTRSHTCYCRMYIWRSSEFQVWIGDHRLHRRDGFQRHAGSERLFWCCFYTRTCGNGYETRREEKVRKHLVFLSWRLTRSGKPNIQRYGILCKSNQAESWAN